MRLPITAALEGRFSGTPSLWRAAGKIIPHLLRFLMPWACAGCQTPLTSLADDGFCGRCWLALPRIQGTVCQICGVPFSDGGQWCYDCKQVPLRLRIRAAVRYEGLVSRSIHRFKYMGRKSLANPFSVLLNFAWQNYPEFHSGQGLVPVPLHSRQERIRGFNQAEVLAQSFGESIRRPVLSLLERTRRTASQVTLKRPERQSNVSEAFQITPEAEHHLNRLKNRPVLLVDDVCTTGSTLVECARTLRQHGIRPLGALVLARDL